MMKLGEVRETATGSVWLTKRTDLGTYAVMVFTQKARGWFTQYSGSLKECRARAEELLKEMTEEETAAETTTAEEPETHEEQTTEEEKNTMKYKVVFEFLNPVGEWKETDLSNNEEGFTKEDAEDVARQLREREHRNVKVTEM